MAPTSSTQVVESLFTALVANDVAGANALLADDIVWRNTGLPTARGRLVRRILVAMPKLRIRFSAVDHAFSSQIDGSVRFDRRDTLRWGPFSTTFFVSGIFEVSDGKVRRWDDRYRMGEVLGGLFRRR
jgi:limonene-1,2-epoxide hydrolase